MVLLRALSPDSVYVQVIRKELPEVEGHEAVTALIDRM